MSARAPATWSAAGLLRALHRQGLTLVADGDQLILRGPRVAIIPAIVEDVKANKATLLAELRRRGLVAPAECGWCGGALAPYLIPLAGGPALHCPSCHRWTLAGGSA